MHRQYSEMKHTNYHLVPLSTMKQVQYMQRCTPYKNGTTKLTLSTQLRHVHTPCLLVTPVPDRVEIALIDMQTIHFFFPGKLVKNNIITSATENGWDQQNAIVSNPCGVVTIKLLLPSASSSATLMYQHSRDMRANVSATALRQETIRYYHNAPASELTLIKDVVFYTESTSLRDRADDLSTHRSNSRSHWGSLVELYVLAVVTGISFRHGYWYSPLEGVQTTTIHPLFTNLPPEVTRSVILCSQPLLCGRTNRHKVMDIPRSNAYFTCRKKDKFVQICPLHVERRTNLYKFVL